MFWYRVIWFLSWLPLRLLLPTKIIGRENLPKGKAILSSNHQSNWDPVLLLGFNWERPFVLAKHTLFQKKFNSKVLKTCGGIPIDRENVGIGTIKQVIKILNDEKKLLIFPQGTRMQNMEENNSIKNGLAMFALKTKSPIVPIMFVKKPKMFHFNKILIGKPFELTEFYNEKASKEILSKASERVIEEMTKLLNDYLDKQKSKTNKSKKAI